MKCYRVMRDCHNSSGVCDLCTTKTGKIRRVQMDNIDKRTASRVAKNWHEFNATVEEINNGPEEKPESDLEKVANIAEELHSKIFGPKDQTLYTLKTTTLPGGGSGFRFAAEIEADGEVFEVKICKLR